jgi:hypothetical protein
MEHWRIIFWVLVPRKATLMVAVVVLLLPNCFLFSNCSSYWDQYIQARFEDSMGTLPALLMVADSHN